MSQWTHINGSIRIDDYVPGERREEFRKYIEKLLGKQYDFEDLLALEDRDPETILPLGSEGSIKYTIWENPNDCHVNYMTVNIFGDLRNFGLPEIPGVIKWFKNILMNIDFRSAILEIDVEYGPKIILLGNYNCKKNIYNPTEELIIITMENDEIIKKEVEQLKNKWGRDNET